MEMEMITRNRVALLLPRRPRTGHKGAFGKLLIVAGSRGMAGAAVLSARGALRAGAGLVRVSIDDDLFPIVQTGVIEAICVGRDFDTGSPVSDLKNGGATAAEPALDVSAPAASGLPDCDAVVIGPGLGVSAFAAGSIQKLLDIYGDGVTEDPVGDAFVGTMGNQHDSDCRAGVVDTEFPRRHDNLYGANVVENAEFPLKRTDAWRSSLSGHTALKAIILDADALNLIARRKVSLERIAGTGRPRLIMTPHAGEAARLLSCSPEEINRDRFGAVRALADQYGAVTVLKGHKTLVAGADGRVYANPTGNPGMATAGSGDVLSGIIGAFAGQGMDALDAACAGVYVHGLAGDMAASEIGEYGLIASDIAAAVPKAIRHIQKNGA